VRGRKRERKDAQFDKDSLEQEISIMKEVRSAFCVWGLGSQVQVLGSQKLFWYLGLWVTEPGFYVSPEHTIRSPFKVNH